MPEHKPTPRQRFMQMITGYWISQSIHVAAKLKLADLVKDGPKTADELAKFTNTNPQSLYRLLRALSSVEIFAEDEEGRFAMTPMAECLLDVPGSPRAVALISGGEVFAPGASCSTASRRASPRLTTFSAKAYSTTWPSGPSWRRISMPP